MAWHSGDENQALESLLEGKTEDADAPRSRFVNRRVKGYNRIAVPLLMTAFLLYTILVFLLARSIILHNAELLPRMSHDPSPR